MKINKFLMLTGIGLTFFTSCSNDDDLPVTPGESTADYSNGIFILNEGNFRSGNSSVSYIDETHESITYGIFGKANEEKPLGDVGQSIGFYEDYAFIVVNVSNKIEVVDRTTFENVATINTGLMNPRYVGFTDGKAYVTNWGDGGNPDDDFVTIIDVMDFTVEDQISVAEGPESIIANAGKIYVAHKGGHSFNNIVSVIDPSTKEVIETVQVGDQPNALIIEDGTLWVSCFGKPGFSGAESAGSILKINLANHEVVQEFSFSESTDHPDNLDVEEGKVYYTLGNSVYSFGEAETSLPETAILELTEVEVLRDVEVEDGYIFAASANSSFTGNGELYIYKSTGGTMLNTFETGINPNGIYFNR